MKKINKVNVTKSIIIAFFTCINVGCITFKYGPIAYLEPGGEIKEANIAVKECSLLNENIVSLTLEKLKIQKSLSKIKNASLIMTPGFPPCLNIQGEEIKEKTK